MDRFSDYVRSAVFRIDLSQKMIVALVALQDGKDIYSVSIATWRALHHRGLVDYTGMLKRPLLTSPGRKILDLLLWVGVINFTQPVVKKGEPKKYTLKFGIGDKVETQTVEACSEDEAHDMAWNCFDNKYGELLIIDAEPLI